MGRARNSILAVLLAQDRSQDRFAAAMGDKRGARRSGDLAPGAERIRQLGFDAPGLDREAQLLADTVNQQTEAQRGQPNILVGVPEFTARDVAPFASILLKNQAACAAPPDSRATFDSLTLTSLVNLIVNAGSQRAWDMTPNSSFMLKNLLWWHAQTVGAAGGEDDPALNVSAEVDAIKALYERLCEHFRAPEQRRTRQLRWPPLPPPRFTRGSRATG
jgi:hypothetical protein